MIILSRVFGAFVFIGSLVILFHFENSDYASFGFRLFHWPAMVLTGLGPIGIIFLSHDFNRVKEALLVLWRASPGATRKKNRADHQLLSHLGPKFYTHGVRAFEEAEHAPISKPLKRTLKRLIAKMPVSDVIDQLNREYQSLESNYEQNLEVFMLGGRMAPSVGMLGTILGMVQLLASLEDPAKIGSHMSVALLTTFFGLFFSLLIWTPAQQKIQSAMNSELSGYQQILHWLELLDEKKPVHYFEESEAKTS